MSEVLYHHTLPALRLLTRITQAKVEKLKVGGEAFPAAISLLAGMG
jgi:RNA 3'-terminal phosphate cyclase